MPKIYASVAVVGVRAIFEELRAGSGWSASCAGTGSGKPPRVGDG